MNILGKDVHSTVFGCGTVTEQAETTVTVDFSGMEKKFLYPFAFEKHLTAAEPALQEALTAEIEAQNVERARRQRNEMHRANFLAEQQKAEQKKADQKKPSARKSTRKK